MNDVQIRFAGKDASLFKGRALVARAQLAEVVREVARVVESQPRCRFIPDGVRFWQERRDAVAVIVEVPPQARTVRWIRSDSPAPCGPWARYGRYFLAFPYIELLLIFRAGALTGETQLYYRRAPLEEGDDLLLPNLHNVTPHRGYRCWVCLSRVRVAPELSWHAKIRAIVDHVFTAAFNLSAELVESHTYWARMRSIDPRVSSMEAWQEATRRNPRFALDVPWPPAGTTATVEIARMLDAVVSPPRLHTAADIASVVIHAASGRRVR